MFQFPSPTYVKPIDEILKEIPDLFIQISPLLQQVKALCQEQYQIGCDYLECERDYSTYNNVNFEKLYFGESLRNTTDAKQWIQRHFMAKENFEKEIDALLSRHKSDEKRFDELQGNYGMLFGGEISVDVCSKTQAGFRVLHQELTGFLAQYKEAISVQINNKNAWMKRRDEMLENCQNVANALLVKYMQHFASKKSDAGGVWAQGLFEEIMALKPSKALLLANSEQFYPTMQIIEAFYKNNKENFKALIQYLDLSAGKPRKMLDHFICSYLHLHPYASHSGAQVAFNTVMSIKLSFSNDYSTVSKGPGSNANVIHQAVVQGALQRDTPFSIVIAEIYRQIYTQPSREDLYQRLYFLANDPQEKVFSLPNEIVRLIAEYAEIGVRDYLAEEYDERLYPWLTDIGRFHLQHSASYLQASSQASSLPDKPISSSSALSFSSRGASSSSASAHSASSSLSYSHAGNESILPAEEPEEESEIITLEMLASETRSPVVTNTHSGSLSQLSVPGPEAKFSQTEEESLNQTNTPIARSKPSSSSLQSSLVQIQQSYNTRASSSLPTGASQGTQPTSPSALILSSTHSSYSSQPLSRASEDVKHFNASLTSSASSVPEDTTHSRASLSSSPSTVPADTIYLLSNLRLPPGI